MNVLIITNLFPYKENPSAGIFLTKRLALYESLGVKAKTISLALQDADSGIRLLKRLIKRWENTPIEKLGNVQYEPVFLTRGSWELLRYAIGLRRRLINESIETLLERTISYLSKVEEKFDLIHAHGMYASIIYSLVPAGLIAKRVSEKLNVPYIVSLHGNDVNKYMKQKNLRLVYVETLERASKCIFVSNALLERAKSYGYSGKNAVVIPNGYDPEIFKPIDKDETRKRLGIYKEGYKYVGFVGNLIPVKRADKLGEIFKYVNQECAKTIFIVVGDGYLRKKIEKQTKGLEIVFTGRVQQEKVAEYMNAMDVMVLPSRSEGFGAVVIEAQACGTCVVGSNSGGIPEAIGFEEYVVEEGKNFEKRFAKKVIEVLKKGYDSNTLIKRAKSFTWEEIVKREIDLYSETVGDVK
ncbi:MAG: glycosyltransferase family 4 protein [Pseudothermotoga sp.]